LLYTNLKIRVPAIIPSRILANFYIYISSGAALISISLRILPHSANTNAKHTLNMDEQNQRAQHAQEYATDLTGTEEELNQQAEKSNLHPSIRRKLKTLNEVTLPSIKVQTRSDFMAAFHKQKAQLDKKTQRRSPKNVLHIPTPTELPALEGAAFDYMDSDEEDDIPPWFNNYLLDACAMEFDTMGTAECIKYMNTIRRIHGCNVTKFDEDLSNGIMLLEFMYCTIPDLFLPEPAQLANQSELAPSSSTNVTKACGVETEFTKENYPDVCARNKKRIVDIMGNYAYYSYFTDGVCLKRRNYGTIMEKMAELLPFFILTSALFGPNRENLVAHMFSMDRMDILAISDRVEKVMEDLHIENPNSVDIFRTEPTRILHRCDKLFYKDEESLLEHVTRRQRDRSYTGYYGAVQNGEIVDFQLLIEYRKEKDEIKESGSDREGSGHQTFGSSTEASDKAKKEDESGDDEPVESDGGESEESAEDEESKEEGEPVTLGRMDYTKAQLWDFIERLQKDLEAKEEEEERRDIREKKKLAKSKELYDLVKSENSLLKKHKDKMCLLTERLTSDKEKLNSVCNKYRAKLDKFKEKELKWKEVIVDLENIQAAVSQYDTVVVENETYSDRIKVLEGEKKILQNNWDLDLNKLSFLTKKINRLEADEKEFVEQISQMKLHHNYTPSEREEQLEKLVERKKKEHNELIDLLSEKDAMIANLQQRAKHGHSSAEMEMKTAELARSNENEKQEDIDGLLETLKAMEEDLREAEKERQAIAAQLKEQRRLVDKLTFEKKSTAEELRTEWKSAKNLAENANLEIDELKTQLRKQQAEAQKLKRDLKEATISSFRKDKNILECEAAKKLVEAEASSEVKAAKAISAQLKSTNSELKDQLKNLQANERHLQKEVFEKTKKLMELQTKPPSSSNAVDLQFSEKKIADLAQQLGKKEADERALKKAKDADERALKKAKDAELALKLAKKEAHQKSLLEDIEKKSREREADLELKLSKKEGELSEEEGKRNNLLQKVDKLTKELEKAEELREDLVRKRYHAEEQVLVREEELAVLKQELHTKTGPETEVDDDLDNILTPREANMTPRRLSGKTIMESAKLMRTLRENIDLKKKLCDLSSSQL